MMPATRIVVISLATVLTACMVGEDRDDLLALRHNPGALGEIANCAPFRNPSGFAATFSTTGSVKLTGAFFTSFGTNGRTCGTCHLPSDGWTITPATVDKLFRLSNGEDPIFRLVDGANSPNADVSTRSKRKRAYSMLREKGLIRVGIAIPPNAEFELEDVDDPYGFASASELSLFRRPLPTANLRFLSTLMWDGRETRLDPNTPPKPTSNCLLPPFERKCFLPIDPDDLLHQAAAATVAHAEAMVPGLTPGQMQEIVDFETPLMFAQVSDKYAGNLDVRGALGGPIHITEFPAYFGINDNFGDYRTGEPFTPIIFTQYDAWADGGTTVPQASECGLPYDRRDNLFGRAARKAIARGQELFNTKPITISGVGGLNGVLGLPASFVGTCGTCHDALHAGNHSVPAPLDIGVADGARRTSDMPMYTLRCSSTGLAAGHCTAGQTIETTDPGRAMITGLWADIGKFKGPVLRGLAARAPYFHNGSAEDLGAVVDFYEDRFGVDFTRDERRDLIAFLRSL
jgi:cytochrome c peroxidase